MTYQDDSVQNKIDFNNRDTHPNLLDDRYGYLLSNGFYNYQEYINHLAKKAQAGDSESLEACLYYMGWRGEGLPGEILGYYYQQLTTGAIDVTRKDTLSFIKLFANEKERAALNNPHVNRNKTILATKRAQYISNRLSLYKTKKEVFEDLVDLLIDRIIKYKQGDRTLRKYIYDMFYLYVGDYIQRLFRSKDLLIMKTWQSSEDIENISTEPYELDVNLRSKDHLYEREQDKGDLGVFWIHGHCHPIFQDLTVTQRLIIRDSYFYKIGERPLAKKYGVSRDVIKRLKRESKEIIKKSAKQQNENYNTLRGYLPLTDLTYFEE